jgi:hypothetical protein
MIAAMLALALGAEIALAADFQDAKRNVCEGKFTAPGCRQWGKHVTGSENVALGDEMMPNLSSGSGNVALDFRALLNNTTGGNNVAIGSHALYENTTGQSNLATGFDALEHNTTAEHNVAYGVLALRFNTTGESNLASGVEALYENTTGSRNLASGTVALFHNTTGSDNLAFGFGAGDNLTTGSNNIEIANEGVAGDAGKIRIGTEGTQTEASMAGIYEKEIAKPTCIVKVNSAGQLGCKEPGTLASSFSAAGSPALVAQVSRQQQEINQLASEVKSLREQIHPHR